jgi:glycosyltransferase involved in cell wall biosynthesis
MTVDYTEMRIGLVSTYMPPHPGGIEHVAANLFAGYGRAGHPVRWLTSRIPRDLPRHEGPVVRVPCWNAVEDALGVPVPVWGPTAIGELRRLARWADVLHVVEALYLPSAMAVAVARLAGKPVVLSQNIGFVPYRRRAIEWIERAAYATLGRAVLLGSSHVVLATPSAEHFVRSLLGPRLARASSIPVGIDTDAFRPATPGERAEARRSLGIEDDRAVALFAGRLVEKKGLPVILDAASRLPGVRFLVAGDGPLRDLRRGAPANTRWLGHVGRESMVRLYHASDVVLLPSRGEGLPLFVQEAMACGLPAIVTSDEAYAGELLALGLCWGAPAEGAAVARVVGEVLGTPAERRTQAREYAVRCWGMDGMAARYVAIMRGLVPGGQPRPAPGPTA